MFLSLLGRIGETERRVYHNGLFLLYSLRLDIPTSISLFLYLHLMNMYEMRIISNSYLHMWARFTQFQRRPKGTNITSLARANIKSSKHLFILDSRNAVNHLFLDVSFLLFHS